MSQKTAATRAGRLPVSRAVLWAGIAVGVFLATEAVLHRVVLPLALPAFADVVMTFLLIIASAVVLAELTRRHHRGALRHGRRISASGVRRVRRDGTGVLAWLVARAGPRWGNREHRPLMFGRFRGESAGPAEPAETGGSQGAEGSTYSFGRADQPSAWPVDDPEEAHSRARQMSTGGNPWVVTEYPPGGGPGRTIATYVHGKPSQPTEGTSPMTTQPSYKGGGFGIMAGYRGTGNAGSPAGSRIAPEHRARRAAARTGGSSVPSEWGPVITQTADFEPENDGELLDWMGRQVTGLSAWAEALVDTYEHCTAVIGIDPQASAMLHDVADAAAQAAETTGAAKAKFTEHYELPREFAANGGLMTHDGRWITGDGA